MKEIGAIFVVSISEIRTVQLAAIKRRYNILLDFRAIFSTQKKNFSVPGYPKKTNLQPLNSQK